MIYYLTEAQISEISSSFPSMRGFKHVDDRRVISGIIYVLKHGLQWRDVPKEYSS